MGFLVFCLLYFVFFTFDNDLSYLPMATGNRSEPPVTLPASPWTQPSLNVKLNTCRLAEDQSEGSENNTKTRACQLPSGVVRSPLERRDGVFLLCVTADANC